MAAASPRPLGMIARLAAFAAGLAALGFAFALLSAFARGAFIAYRVPAPLLPFADGAVVAVMLSFGLVGLKLGFFAPFSVRVLVVGLGFVGAGLLLPRLVALPSGDDAPVITMPGALPLPATLEGGALLPLPVDPSGSAASTTTASAEGATWVRGTREPGPRPDGFVRPPRVASAPLHGRATDDGRALRKLSARDLRALERQIVDEVNRVRAGPRAYRPVVVDTQATLRDTLAFLTPSGLRVAAVEGPAAFIELEGVLEQRASMQLLERDAILDDVARDHAQDLGRRGARGHQNADGQGVGARIRARGAKGAVGEAIAFGLDDARDVVLALLVDDGVPGRGHRDLLLDETFSEVGAGCARHAVHDVVCVLELAIPGPGGPPPVEAGR